MVLGKLFKKNKVSQPTQNDNTKEVSAIKRSKKTKKAKKVSPNRIVIKEPVVSEKSRGLSVESKYTFWVEGYANKSDVKKEVEHRWNVSVDNVHMVKKFHRSKNYRGRMSKSTASKKAIVTLREGDSIDIFAV